MKFSKSIFFFLVSAVVLTQPKARRQMNIRLIIIGCKNCKLATETIWVEHIVFTKNFDEAVLSRILAFDTNSRRLLTHSNSSK